MGLPSVPVDQRGSWEETDKNVAFTELHAMSLADMDGDGLKDIITGKRWYSHGYRYDEEDDITDPPVIYVFHLKRAANNQVQWVPQLITNHHDSPIQMAIADVDGDGKPDIVTSGRKGTAILFNKGPQPKESVLGPSATPIIIGIVVLVLLLVALWYSRHHKTPHPAPVH